MDAIDLGRAIKAPFNDKDWVSKTLFGFLWMLLGITSPAVYGAHIEYIKGVSEGREELPAWDDFGGKWVKGLLLSIAYFIYLLPIWVLFFIMVLPGILTAAASNGEMGGALLGGGVCLFVVIALVYGIAVAILMYGATVNYALKGGFGSLFAVSDILTHVRDGSGYFAAWLWAIVIGVGASVAVSVLSATVIGYILVPAVLYLQIMMSAHVFGQWAARSYGVTAAVATPQTGYAPPPPPVAAPVAPPAPEASAPPAPPAPPVPPAPVEATEAVPEAAADPEPATAPEPAAASEPPAAAEPPEAPDQT